MGIVGINGDLMGIWLYIFSFWLTFWVIFGGYKGELLTMATSWEYKLDDGG
jgi:hypothetical protein